MAAPSAPRDTTIRKLFAVSMNRCAFPDCQTPVIDLQTNTIVAEVCHIHAQNEGGPRFLSSQTPEERHAFENLVLLCSVHHKVIDAPENLATYTAAHLKNLKAEHEKTARESGVPLPFLTDDLLLKLQELSTRYENNAVHMDFRGAMFRAGGEGGEHGGGGGGGGIITIVGTTHPPLGALIDLAGKDGKAPGGGGGGGGVIRFVGRDVTPEDIASGLRISSIFIANAVTVSGLFHVLGGGWSFCSLPAIPFQIGINVVCVVELGTITPETLLRFDIEVLNPQGTVLLTEPRDITVVYSSIDLTPRLSFAHFLQFEVNELGVWTIRVTSMDTELAKSSIELRLDAPT